MKKYYIAAIFTILYIPAITVAGELIKPLKDFLKNVFWHHWLGKSVILIAVFIIASLLFGKIKDENVLSDEKYFSWITRLAFLGALAIFVFFTYEYLKMV